MTTFQDISTPPNVYFTFLSLKKNIFTGVAAYTCNSKNYSELFSKSWVPVSHANNSSYLGG
jgi:hypothetical protein